MTFQHLHPLFDIIRDIYNEGRRHLPRIQIVKNICYAMGLALHREGTEVSEIDPMRNQVSRCLMIRVANAPPRRAIPIGGQHQGRPLLTDDGCYLQSAGKIVYYPAIPKIKDLYV